MTLPYCLGHRRCVRYCLVNHLTAGKINEKVKCTVCGCGSVFIGFGLRKDDSALKQQLDTAIDKVQADGTLTALAKKYFPGIDVATGK